MMTTPINLGTYSPFNFEFCLELEEYQTSVAVAKFRGLEYPLLLKCWLLHYCIWLRQCKWRRRWFCCPCKLSDIFVVWYSFIPDWASVLVLQETDSALSTSGICLTLSQINTGKKTSVEASYTSAAKDWVLVDRDAALENLFECI